MPETKTITFTNKEIAEFLVKHVGIHEGFWGILVEFGIGAANVAFPPSGDALVPAAIVPIVKMGIHRFDEPNSLTVDAAKVNPATAAPPRKPRSSSSSERAGPIRKIRLEE
jgi:hypothetical protein